MPEFTAVHLAILASFFAVGVVLGWLLRNDRSAREKIAINAGWKEQVENCQAENDRLEEQNKGLMQQVSEHQARQAESEQQTRSTTTSLKAALREVREQNALLERQSADARTKLDALIRERNLLQSDLRSRHAQSDAEANSLREKDNKIFKLSRELSSWQSRVPPLVEKFRQRDREAQELQRELDKATNRIVELEVMTRPDETHIEKVDRDSLGLRLDASNDQYDDNPEQELAGLEDQIVDPRFHSTGHTGRGHEPELFGDFLNDPALSGQDVFPGLPGSGPETGERHASANGRDDLQRIKGIGPAIEKTLNELGIYRFEQIAEISEYDIDRVAEHLKGLRTRIYREDWIGQARALHNQSDPVPW